MPPGLREYSEGHSEVAWPNMTVMPVVLKLFAHVGIQSSSSHKEFRSIECVKTTSCTGEEQND